MLKIENICCCPICKGDLVWLETLITCKKCGEKYPIREGIPCFLKEPQYWCMISREKMNDINKYIQQHGWEKGFKEQVPPEFHNIIKGIGRDDFRFFMPISRNAVGLDLGCMWGAWTFSLAKHCKQIIGIDQTFETLRMADLRKRNLKVNNVNVMRSNAFELPFIDSIFDFAIVNGVLEWIGAEKEFITERDFGKKTSGSQNNYLKSPRDFQVKALKEIWRALKPGGIVYIGIENRISWRSFLGANDPHSGLPYNSLMPRWLANIYMKSRVGKAYRTYTYTLNGLSKLLNEARFKKIQFFTAIPEYSYPNVIFPLKERFLQFYVNNLRQFHSIDNPNRKSKIKHKLFDFISNLGLATHFVECFLVLARK